MNEFKLALLEENAQFMAEYRALFEGMADDLRLTGDQRLKWLREMEEATSAF